MNATVLGATGFIGHHLVRHLTESGADVFSPARDDGPVFNKSLGHVFNCIGLTADFRQRPIDTIQAHVCYLLEFFSRAKFESFIYLSSTRVYAASTTAREDQPLLVNPGVPGDLYNLSKLTGEAACLAFARPSVRIVRLSNVYGNGMDSHAFLASLVDEAVGRSRVVLQTSGDSAKDYVWVGDVVRMLPKVALGGRHRIYNVASGVNISTHEITTRLRELTGCEVESAPNTPINVFPAISIDRLKAEFAFAPNNLIDLLPELARERRKILENQ